MKIAIKYESDEPGELKEAQFDFTEMTIRQHDRRVNDRINSHLFKCHKLICNDLGEIIEDEQHKTAHAIQSIYQA